LYLNAGNNDESEKHEDNEFVKYQLTLFVERVEEGRDDGIVVVLFPYN